MLSFLLKILFTALTLGAGFKGDGIVPSFYIGAAFGCAVASILGLPVPLYHKQKIMYSKTNTSYDLQQDYAEEHS